MNAFRDEDEHVRPVDRHVKKARSNFSHIQLHVSTSDFQTGFMLK